MGPRLRLRVKQVACEQLLKQLESVVGSIPLPLKILSLHRLKTNTLCLPAWLMPFALIFPFSPRR